MTKEHAAQIIQSAPNNGLGLEYLDPAALLVYDEHDHLAEIWLHRTSLGKWQTKGVLIDPETADKISELARHVRDWKPVTFRQMEQDVLVEDCLGNELGWIGKFKGRYVFSNLMTAEIHRAIADELDKQNQETKQ